MSTTTKRIIIASAVVVLGLVIAVGFITVRAVYRLLGAGGMPLQIITNLSESTFPEPVNSPAEAAALESTLKNNPEDLEARRRLIFYYWAHRSQLQSAMAAHSHHVLWLIKNHPESDALSDTTAELAPGKQGAAIAEATHLWKHNLAAHPQSAAITANAACFFMKFEPTTGEELVSKAESLDPSSPKWPEKFGHLYVWIMNGTTGEAHRDAARNALSALEAWHNLAGGGIDADSQLDELSTAAFEAGDTEKARSYGQQLLDSAGQGSLFAINSGNAIHKGNLILGRAALKAGDIEKAKSYLLAAGQTSGSPNLDSFGPNMLLAKEMLEKGERQTVLDYFTECSKFWDPKCENGLLARWSAEVKAGKIPDFGPNLIY